MPCLHGCPAFLQRHSPWQSPPSHPLRPETISPESTAVFALGLLSNAPFQLLATIHSGELASLSRVCKAATWKSVWVLTPFRLLQISCFTLTASNAPCLSELLDLDVGISPLLQLSHCLGAGPILLALLFFPSFFHPTEF